MPQIARSIDVEAPVDTTHQQWLCFEDLPRCAAHSLVANVRWRAEVLTFEPIDAGTRVTLKVEYDPGECDAALPCRLEAVLQGFTVFLARRAAARPV